MTWKHFSNNDIIIAAMKKYVIFAGAYFHEWSMIIDRSAEKQHSDPW